MPFKDTACRISDFSSFTFKRTRPIINHFWIKKTQVANHFKRIKGFGVALILRRICFRSLHWSRWSIVQERQREFSYCLNSDCRCWAFIRHFRRIVHISTYHQPKDWCVNAKDRSWPRWWGTRQGAWWPRLAGRWRASWRCRPTGCSSDLVLCF